MKSIGHMYPKVRLPKDQGGGEANVIAWIWVRTVASPNPAMQGRQVPLMSTFWLASKPGKQVWLEPILDSKLPDGWRFTVRTGIAQQGMRRLQRTSSEHGSAKLRTSSLSSK